MYYTKIIFPDKIDANWIQWFVSKCRKDRLFRSQAMRECSERLKKKWFEFKKQLWKHTIIIIPKKYRKFSYLFPSTYEYNEPIIELTKKSWDKVCEKIWVYIPFNHHKRKVDYVKIFKSIKISDRIEKLWLFRDWLINWKKFKILANKVNIDVDYVYTPYMMIYYYNLFKKDNKVL